MKLNRKLVGGSLILGGFVALISLLHAQETETTLSQVEPLPFSGRDVASFSSLSEAELAALVGELDAKPTLTTNALPYNGQAGTFWSLARPDSAPLPCDLPGVNVWVLNNGSFLLNDVGYSYLPASRRSLARGGMQPMELSEITPDFGTNLYLAQVGLSAGNIVGIVTNSQPDILYEIQSKPALQQDEWVFEDFLYGSETTNWTALAVAQGDRTNLFLRIRSWADTTGTGIPDWWWLIYFGQTTNVDAYASAAGDDYDNFDKFEMGLDPTTYYTTNAPGGFYGYLDPTGTNAFIAWNPSPGPVTNYLIRRGIYNPTLGNYDYAQIGAVSSNATFFEDVGAITNANALNNLYSVQAAYPGGSLSPATATWKAGWYGTYGGYGPPYGPPLPGNVYPYADATGTNILLSWTPAQGAATNYIVLRGFLTNYAYSYQPVAQVATNTLAVEIVGVLTNLESWGDDYAVQAVYPGGGLSYVASAYTDYPVYASIRVGSNLGSNAPAGFYGYADSTGTNIFLNWNPLSGVTNYIIYGGVWNDDVAANVHVQLATVGASTNSFKVVGAMDGGGNNLYDFYNVVAVYAGGVLSSNAAWDSSAGAPAPGALSAYLDATGTNALLAWTPAADATGYVIQKSDDYGYDGTYHQINVAGSGTTSYEDVNGVASGYAGVGSISYEVQATYPNGGLSPAISATLSTNLPAPSSVMATVDATGTNVSLTWSPAVGIVSDYAIFRGTYDPNTGNYSYSQVGTVSAGTTSFQDIGAITGNNSYNNVYQVRADYSGGRSSHVVSSSVAQSSTPSASNLKVTAQLVRNQTGRWQLMFSSIPTNVQAVALSWYLWDYFYDIGPIKDPYPGYPFTVETDIPVGNLTNGIYVVPDFMTTNGVPDNSFGKVAMIQSIGTNNQRGSISQVGFLPYDAPCFVDGRQHLKQNLLFGLRAATVSQPCSFLYEPDVYDDPFYFNLGLPADTNYVESSIFHWSEMFKGYGNGSLYTPGYMKMDNLWPFTANYELHQSLFDTNYTGPASFVWQTDLMTVPASAVLDIATPYWISQGLGNLAEVAAYTNSGSLYLQSGTHNLFGLAFSNALVNPGGYQLNMFGQFVNTPFATVAPGSSVSESNVSTFFSQTTGPNLQITNYYFAPVNTPGTALPLSSTPYQAYPLPAHTGFANTNQTQVIIASVGNPTVIGGWAKAQILNGASTKFAYLGQYFLTNAYVVNASGAITTNTTGIVSPYGDLFPTEPGMVAMITMPDIDTGQQGTGMVRVVSMNADANHDGTLDFKYNSPDFVSSSKPFRFWVNDDKDWSDDVGDGIPEAPIPDGSTPIQVQNTNVSFLSFNSVWKAHGRRDLVDFFPVDLNIGSLFQSNAISSGISLTDTNYRFVLSQAAGALRFAYTDLTPGNYMNFLRDTNESGSLAYAPLTTITATGVALTNAFLSGIATNNQGIILVEAWTNTTQPLMLTIYHGTNQIAQTSLALSISGVEQMFRHKNLLLSASPAMPDRLTDADVPNEPDTIDKNFIFAHGYNVNPKQARGWDADFYKRMYWSGSHAKFYGVTWEASDSQLPGGGVTVNLQANIVNAFLTTSNFATFIGTLSGENVVAAHSLGNMLVLGTLNDCTNISFDISKFFMIDAAVPIEAIQGNATPDVNMIYPDWRPYTNRLYASDWWQLFPTNDARSTLTWNNRLANFGSTTVYNFYSSGEEVLREYTNGVPPSELVGSALEVEYYLVTGEFNTGLPAGDYTWAWQEMLKGRGSVDFLLSSSHGGWKFNLGTYYYITNSMIELMPPDQAALVPSSQLKTNAFFDVTSLSFIFADTALFGTNGSAYAQANRNRILSDSIPALTLPVGANAVTNLDIEFGGKQNFDMKNELENGWPVGRMQNATELNNWHHSDCRQVAYTFTYKFFDNIVTLGGLQ